MCLRILCTFAFLWAVMKNWHAAVFGAMRSLRDLFDAAMGLIPVVYPCACRFRPVYLNSPCRHVAIQLNTLRKAIPQEDSTITNSRESIHKNDTGSSSYLAAEGNTRGLGYRRRLTPRCQIVFKCCVLQRQ
jgi:hypothetical protein